MGARRKWTDYLSSMGAQRPLLEPEEIPEQPKRRRPGSFPKPRPLEKDIKTAIVQCLKLHPAVIPESVTVVGVSGGQIMRRDGSLTPWRRWGEPGTPDLVGRLRDGRKFRIEVKTPARRREVSEEQREMLDETIAAGGIAGVATSVEEAIAIVEGRG